jgi:hypothetical protein
MSSKVIKFQSDQAGSFDVSNNKVDLVLPSYIGYSDLSRSSVIINMKLRDKNNAGNYAGLIDQAFNAGLDASCMVKNCSMVSDNVGTIEDLPANNVWNANTDVFTKDFEDVKSAHTYGYSNEQGIGTFIRKNKWGAVCHLRKHTYRYPSQNFSVLVEQSSSQMGC